MDNLESDYAKDALLTWYRLLHHGKLTSVTFEDFCHRTGLRLEYEGELVEKLPLIQRWLNRILALPIAIQNAIFDNISALLKRASMPRRKPARSMPASRRSAPTS